MFEKNIGLRFTSIQKKTARQFTNQRLYKRTLYNIQWVVA